MDEAKVIDFKTEFFSEVLFFYSETRDKILSILKEESSENNEFLSCVFNLIKYIAERSITISLLIQNNLLWDAQILMRTVQEATMKVCFLCNCSEIEQQIRLKEYLYDLQEVNSIKLSEQAKRMIPAFSGNDLMTIPFKSLILDEELANRLRNKWPAKQRKKLEQKWSFSEMMKEQSAKIPELADMFLSLAHPYRMSSHLVHADETGIGIVAERSLRNNVEKELIETVHFCSLLDYSVTYLVLCGFALCTALNKTHEPFQKIYTDLRPTLDKMKIYEEELYKDPVYDKFR